MFLYRVLNLVVNLTKHSCNNSALLLLASFRITVEKCKNKQRKEASICERVVCVGTPEKENE